MNPEDLVPTDPVWFWWPVTFAIGAAGVAAHIAGVARRNDVTPSRPLAFAAIAVLSIAIPIIPLTIGLGAACSDTGLDPRINIYGLMVGIPALVVWVAIVWRLYLAAGGDPSYAERYPLTLFFGIIAGIVLEFVFSMSSMENYCQGSWAVARTHLMAAGLCAVIVASLVSAVMWRAQRTRIC